MTLPGILASGGLMPGAPTIGTATDGGNGTSANVAFTAPSWVGKGTGTVTYTATSSPGGLTGTATSSPVTVSGLTTGTAYTFTVKATTSYGVSGPSSASSNSVTPVAPGAFDSIASATPNGVTVVTFNNIPQTYTHLQLRCVARTDATPSSWVTVSLALNNNSTATNYRLAYLEATGNNVGVTASWGDGSFVGSGAYYANSPANCFGMGLTDIFDYTSIDKNKSLRTIWGVCNNTSTTSNNIMRYQSYTFTQTSAITRIDLTSGNGNFVTGTTFALYGIKG